jgi:hypothetical protein
LGAETLPSGDARVEREQRCPARHSTRGPR